MGQRVFVNVAGFTDEERDALNLVFRMSEGHETVFSIWEPEAPEPARVALVDGEQVEGRLQPASLRDANIPIVWVGPQAPADAWRTLSRPIQWAEVTQALDELFSPDAADIGFDLDLEQLDSQPADFQQTQPPDTLPPEVEPMPRALIACASLDERLYLRAKLSLAGLTIADEAETAPQALELVRDNDYVIAIVDLALGGARGWDFPRELSRGEHPIRKVIVTASRPTWVERFRARRSGVAALLPKPPDPTRLQELLAQA